MAVFVDGRMGGLLSFHLSSCVDAPPLPAAHLGTERSIWDGPGRTSAMATPVGRRGHPGYTLSVFVD